MVMMRVVRMVVMWCCLVVASAAGAEPVKLIYDTDMGNDVDDALALAMIHTLQNRGECELLAVTITKDNAECAPYIDAVNTFYGRGDIPIGIVKDGVTPATSKFTGLAQEEQDGKRVYPHDLAVGDPVRDATDVLRAVLAKQPDASVAMVQVGFSTNLARLLDSLADAHSDLSGTALVEKKVSLLSIMAGSFSEMEGKHPEYNVAKDIPSAQAIATRWPTPVVWSGFEIGLALPYPAVSIERDFRYRDRHLIPESYQAYNPTPHERPTWDLTSVIYAVRPDRGYFEVSEVGTVTVDDESFTTFDADPEGKHRYLILEESRRLQIIELMAVLVSEPPQEE
jgi:inosine-uridine nucleoside N-ribohydrolase